ncbi:MAG TPA: ATP-binding cassette domain-containing protein [Thermoanaerobaculia bacterium]|nr:ATP-binding cassette domain-containing protein [Thermoanaerobaculia bacterium]
MTERGFPILSTAGLTVTTAGGRTLLRDVTLQIPAGRVTALIGPSGVGKTTLLKCLNRLIDLTPSVRVTGEVRFAGDDVRGGGIDPDDLRRRIGTVFQQPVTFPGTIAHNVTFAARKIGLIAKRDEPDAVERCLTAAGLWNETKDRLRDPATILSVGQQQRLAIARVLAGDPEVLLMDEPTSALDTRSTAALEETIYSLKHTKTIVMVTHHLPQARRVADWVACLCPREGAGELVEANECELLFDAPEHPGTVEFLSCCSG